MLTMLAPSQGFVLTALVASGSDRAQLRFLEFFAVMIRNAHTRRAYARAASEFLTWCEAHGVGSITGVQPLRVAAWVEHLGRKVSASTVKQRLAGLRHLFDWLVTGQVVATNPAASVRGPAHSVRRGKTPVLAPDEARRLLDAVVVTTPAGLRDRALIGSMVYSFARIGAALAMRVEDVFVQNRRVWVRLHERAASTTRCPATTIWRTICQPISTDGGCARIAKGRFSARLRACQRQWNIPQKWAFPHCRCRHHAMTRARRRSSPARPYMERLMSLSLLILPSTGPCSTAGSAPRAPRRHRAIIRARTKRGYPLRLQPAKDQEPRYRVPRA
jgi:hypothetical protein